MKRFKIGQVEIGLDKPLFAIAGPCVIEDFQSCLDIAVRLVDIREKTGVPIIFKASFDKANRSSIKSYRGVNMHEGLGILKEIRDATGLPVLTDIHECRQANEASRFVDALQIPAYLCRQTNLLVEAAMTGLPVNIKKGQFMSPGEMSNVIEKVWTNNNDKIMLTERGTFFGYNRLVNDMLAIGKMQELECPVIFDATHSTQRPGIPHVMEPDRDKAMILAKAAVAAGANGVYFEVHSKPSESKCDSSTVLPIDWLEGLLTICKRIHEIVRCEM